MALIFCFFLIKQKERKREKNNITLRCSETIHYSLLVIHYKTEGFVRVRDVEGAEGGANWNERRDWYPFNGYVLLSEVQ